MNNEAGLVFNMKKIAIQGIKGSFHDIASHRYFPEEDIELICCET